MNKQESLDIEKLMNGLSEKERLEKFLKHAVDCGFINYEEHKIYLRDIEVLTDRIDKFEKLFSESDIFNSLQGKIQSPLEKSIADNYEVKIQQKEAKIESLKNEREELRNQKNEQLAKVNELNAELQRKQTIINQIDDILNELFGVTHDIVSKPDELKGVLKEKIESIKSVEQITTIINGIPKTYTIDEIGEIVKLYEDIKYCNEHRGEHRHSEEYLKIMSLNNEIARLRELVDKYKNAFEKTKKERDYQICEYQNEINKLASKTIEDFLPTEPIKVVDMLINASLATGGIILDGKAIKEFSEKLFNISELWQIAEHLLIYCNANGEGET